MTKPGTARVTDPPLSQVARHVVAPVGITATSWPKVRDTCHRLGWSFDLWQDGSGRLILSRGEDGLYAADTILISIPRQVGKTYLIACIIFALCLLESGLTVIWTAHRKTTAAETFTQFDSMAQRPKVAAHIRQVLRGKGDEKILFKNRSRILFGARESGFGRGMTDVDVLVWDEGQMLGNETLEDMGATQNVAKNPLTFVMGTPPRPKDAGDFFRLLRREALDGESETTLYIEISADPDADPMDRAQWRKANPSFPKRTTERAMLRLRKKLQDDDSWRREALGIWDEDEAAALDYARWMELVDIGAERGRDAVFGVDVTEERRAWVAVAWQRPDEAFQVMLANDGQHMPAFRIGDYVRELTEKWQGQVTGSKALEDEMPHGFIPLTSADFTIASGGFADLMEAGTVRHGNQPALNHAVKAAKWRSAGTGGERAFQLRDCPEVGPLAAAARALHVLGADVRPFVLS